jgi:hypothetical protein
MYIIGMSLFGGFMKTIKMLSAFIVTAAVASFAQPAATAFPGYGNTTPECRNNLNCIWTLYGDEGGNVVRSGGHWFGYDDSKEKATNIFNGSLKNEGDGGCTTTDFPGREDETSTDIVSVPWNTAGGCVKFSFNNPVGAETCTYAWPFAGIGFNWKSANPNDNGGLGRVTAGDVIAGKKGVKVWYWIKPQENTTADKGDKLLLEFATCDPNFSSGAEVAGCNNNVATQTESNEFFTPLTNYSNVENCWHAGCRFFFEDFVQEAGWGKQLPDGILGTSDVTSNTVGLKFKWSGFSKGSVGDKEKEGAAANVKPATGTFSTEICIRRVSWINEDGSTDDFLYTDGPVPTMKLPAMSSVQMSLVGKTFMVSGLSSHATMEIINMHGVLLTKESVGPSKNAVNASNLKSGVYIVKIKGENVNLVQRVMVK